jgi:hypothetical protein
MPAREAVKPPEWSDSPWRAVGRRTTFRAETHTRPGVPMSTFRRFTLLAGVTLIAACSGRDASDAPDSSAEAGVLADAAQPRAQRLEALLSTLAADSMEGRATGTPGTARAARFLAAELERYGIEAAGDDSYYQTVPLARVEVPGPNGPRPGFVLPSASVDFDTIPADRIVSGEVNVIGIIRGSDPEVGGEAVVIGAHYDHEGIGTPVADENGVLDSIYNGADDDGSGTVAILEVARELAAGTPPRRTVVILLSTAEEFGLLGTFWYIENPVVPMDQTVANLQIEMIGRPDDAAGGFGRGWLTGYERTTMGDQLAAAGSPIIADPRPEMNFFFRSDNVAFAIEGIPGHTLSSYNMHTDYHQPSDEVDKVDFAHMTALVDAAVEAVRFLADGPTPEWKEGGRVGLPGN